MSQAESQKLTSQFKSRIGSGTKSIKPPTLISAKQAASSEIQKVVSGFRSKIPQRKDHSREKEPAKPADYCGKEITSVASGVIIEGGPQGKQTEITVEIAPVVTPKSALKIPTAMKSSGCKAPLPRPDSKTTPTGQKGQSEKRVSTAIRKKPVSFVFSSFVDTTSKADSLLCDVQMDNLEEELQIIESHANDPPRARLIPPSQNNSPQDSSGHDLLVDGSLKDLESPFEAFKSESEFQPKDVCAFPKESPVAQGPEQRVSVISMGSQKSEVVDSKGATLQVPKPKSYCSNIFSMASNQGEDQGSLRPLSKVSGHVRNYSADSKRTLSEEGYTKEMEMESAEMWKLVETIKNKSSIHQRRASGSSDFDDTSSNLQRPPMEVIQENIMEEAFGTDFKKKPERPAHIVKALQEANPSMFKTIDLMRYEQVSNGDPPSHSVLSIEQPSFMKGDDSPTCQQASLRMSNKRLNQFLSLVSQNSQATDSAAKNEALKYSAKTSEARNRGQVRESRASEPSYGQYLHSDFGPFAENAGPQLRLEQVESPSEPVKKRPFEYDYELFKEEEQSRGPRAPQETPLNNAFSHIKYEDTEGSVTEANKQEPIQILKSIDKSSKVSKRLNERYMQPNGSSDSGERLSQLMSDSITVQGALSKPSLVLGKEEVQTEFKKSLKDFYKLNSEVQEDEKQCSVQCNLVVIEANRSSNTTALLNPMESRGSSATAIQKEPVFPKKESVPKPKVSILDQVLQRNKMKRSSSGSTTSVRPVKVQTRHARALNPSSSNPVLNNSEIVQEIRALRVDLCKKEDVNSATFRNRKCSEPISAASIRGRGRNLSQTEGRARRNPIGQEISHRIQIAKEYVPKSTKSTKERLSLASKRNTLPASDASAKDLSSKRTLNKSSTSGSVQRMTKKQDKAKTEASDTASWQGQFQPKSRLQQTEARNSIEKKKRGKIPPGPKTYEYQKIRKERLFNYSTKQSSKDETISEKVQILETQREQMIEQLRHQEQELIELQMKKAALENQEDQPEKPNPSSSFWTSCDDDVPEEHCSSGFDSTPIEQSPQDWDDSMNIEEYSQESMNEQERHPQLQFYTSPQKMQILTAVAYPDVVRDNFCFIEEMNSSLEESKEGAIISHDITAVEDVQILKNLPCSSEAAKVTSKKKLKLNPEMFSIAAEECQSRQPAFKCSFSSLNMQFGSSKFSTSLRDAGSSLRQQPNVK